jgi:ubiquinone/menaquinone biosynthesis C-methylase UbiE
MILMTTPPKENEPGQQFVMDPELIAEMVRLNRQGAFLTEGMGGVLSEQQDISSLHRVLDLACGPGEWALEVAFQYPGIQVIGLDISETMIEYAQAQAEQMGVPAQFQKQNVLAHPLPFPGESFDLINMRFAFAFMFPKDWPPLLSECKRLLRTGGIIRLTECERAMTNSPAIERYARLWVEGFDRAGRTFAPNGVHYGLLPMLKPLVKDSGFVGINHVAYMVDISSDTGEPHDSFFENILTLFKDGMPFLRRMGYAQDDLDRLYDEVQVVQNQSDFYGYWPLMTIWACKPEQK